MTQVEEMYNMWLSGKSIRKIAHTYNIGRGLIQAMLRAEYGKDACSPSKQGLARIVYQEYKDPQTAMKARGVEGLFMSQKTMDNHSKAYRNVCGFYLDKQDENDNLYDYLQQEPEVRQDGLLLPWYLWILERTMAVLDACVEIGNLETQDERTANILGGNQEA